MRSGILGWMAAAVLLPGVAGATVGTVDGAPAAAGTDLAAFKASLDFGPFARGLVGEDARRQSLFRAWWIDPIARSAWLEARGEPILQGASDETG